MHRLLAVLSLLSVGFTANAGPGLGHGGGLVTACPSAAAGTQLNDGQTGRIHWLDRSSLLNLAKNILVTAHLALYKGFPIRKGDIRGSDLVSQFIFLDRRSLGRLKLTAYNLALENIGGDCGGLDRSSFFDEIQLSESESTVSQFTDDLGRAISASCKARYVP